MRITSHSHQSNIITEIDVLSAPMEVSHKHLVLRHFHRLRKIIDAKDVETVSRYTCKQAAQEQLARMTLVLRDYLAKRASGEIEDEEVESMVADMVDASIYVGSQRGTFSQPSFNNPLLMGREQEIAVLMQELYAGDIDDVLELWNAPEATDIVLPDYSNVVNIGEDIDWTRVLVRSKSEDDVLHHQKPLEWKVVKDRPKFTRKLSRRNEEELDRSWPPTPAQVTVYQERRKSRTTPTTDWLEYNWNLED